MPGARIRRLTLRLPGGAPDEARAFARQLSRLIAEQRGAAAGRVRITPRPGESRRALAERIARAVRERGT